MVTGPPTAVNHSIINSVSIQSHLFVPLPLSMTFCSTYFIQKAELILFVSNSFVTLSLFFPLLAYFLLAFATKFQDETLRWH